METTAYEYDAQNRPIAVHTFSSVATNGISHFYRYDARGRRSEYKVELEAEPAGSQRTIAQYGYDANSNLTALKLGLNAPGDTTLRTEFVYDARNRLTRKQSFNKFGTKVSECVYSYFANSNLASRGEFHLPMQGEASSWEATFRHSYDGANRLTGQWQEVSEPLDTMVLYEPIAPEVRAKHRLRLKAGFDTRTVTGTGVKFRGRISANAYTSPLVLAEGYLAMDYDDFGRIMRLLRYDGKGCAIDSLTYQYLNNTGRLGHVRDGVGSAVSGNDVDNQMPNNYAYDASGNMTQDLGSGIGEIRYNLSNLPTALIKSNQLFQYKYDGSGKRIEKVQPNGTFEAYRRGANGELFAIYDNLGALKQFELDGMGEARFVTGDAQQKGSSGATSGNWQFLYYDKDVIGNLRLIVGQDGSIIRTTDLDPWGYEYEPTRTNLTGTNTKWKFLSKEQDTESGYYDLDARKYQPSLGLFLGVEPLYGKYVFMTPFGYGLNNPMSYIDRTGLNPIRFFIRTVKGVWKEVSRFRALKEVGNGDVKVTGRGRSKAAKKLAKDSENWSNKKIVRHDGHELDGGKLGIDHYQPKSGDGTHIFYTNFGIMTSDEIFEALNEIFNPFFGESLNKGFGLSNEDLDNDAVPDSQDEIDNRSIDAIGNENEEDNRHKKLIRNRKWDSYDVEN